MRSLIIASIVGLPLLGWAIPHHKYLTASQGKKDRYLIQGEVRGGEAGRAFILNDVRRAFGPGTKIERYILEFTDGNGEVLKRRPGFYQVNLDPKNQRIVLEFSQILGSRISFKEFAKAVAKSPYVKSSKMTYDPEDSSLTLQLFLKNKTPMEMDVFELPSKNAKGGRLAVDLRTKLQGK